MTYSLRRREVINTPVDNHAHRGGRGTQGNQRGRPRRTMPDLHNTLAEVAISSQPLSCVYVQDIFTFCSDTSSIQLLKKWKNNLLTMTEYSSAVAH